jgi:hypothetical protein
VVLYQDSSGPHGCARKRGYLLYQNESRIERQRPPRFVKIGSVRGLEEVPVFSCASAVTAPAPPIYAIIATNLHSFALYSSGTDVGSYALPVYRDGAGEMERIALTPLAVTADATIAGGAIAGYLGYLYLNGEYESGGSASLPSFGKK